MAVIKTKKASIYGEIYFFEMLANEKTAIYGVKAKQKCPIAGKLEMS